MKNIKLLQYISPTFTSMNPFELGTFHLNEESCMMGHLIDFETFKTALKEVGADMEALESQGLNANPFHSNEEWIFFGIETEEEILVSYWHEDEFATLPGEELDSFVEGDHVGVIDLCGASRGIDRWLVHAETATEVVDKITEFEENL